MLQLTVPTFSATVLDAIYKTCLFNFPLRAGAFDASSARWTRDLQDELYDGQKN